jgi:hypothetical protein
MSAEPTPCPFLSKPFHHENKIERVCTEALEAVGLMPSEPSPVRIDRFIEKQFTLGIEYENLQTRFGEGVMGACKFNRNGNVTRILVDVTLEEDGTRLVEKRLRSTLAHEGGHGLFHGPLFAEMFQAEDAGKLVNVARCSGVTDDGFACRRIGDGGAGSRFDWWEVQANKAMASLLLPRMLVDPFVREIMAIPLPKLAWTGKRPDWDLQDVAGMVADKFDVSISMATYRIQDLHKSLIIQPTLL